MFNNEVLDKSIVNKETELLGIRKSIESLIEENSKIKQNQNEYQMHYKILEKTFTRQKGN